MAEEISIQEAYARIKSGQDGESFSLLIVKGSGKEIGQKVFLARCVYGKKAGSYRKPKSTRDPSLGADLQEEVRRAHVENGTIPLTDLEKNRYLSPFISHIIAYNQYKVIH